MFLPFRIKLLNQLGFHQNNDRQNWIKAANYNLFNLKSDHVMVDFLTDSGTGAMRAEQTASLINSQRLLNY